MKCVSPCTHIALRIFIMTFFFFSQVDACMAAWPYSGIWLRYYAVKLSVNFKAVFHFNRIVARRSVFYCAHIISSVWMLTRQLNTLCYATTRLKWKTVFNRVDAVGESILYSEQCLFAGWGWQWLWGNREPEPLNFGVLVVVRKFQNSTA